MQRIELRWTLGLGLLLIDWRLWIGWMILGFIANSLAHEVALNNNYSMYRFVRLFPSTILSLWNPWWLISFIPYIVGFYSIRKEFDIIRGEQVTPNKEREDEQDTNDSSNTGGIGNRRRHIPSPAR